MAQSKLSYNAIKDIVDLYNTGTKIETLMNVYKISKERILYDILKTPYALEKYGKRKCGRKSKLTPDQRKEIVDFYLQGHEHCFTAKHFNVTKSYVHRLVKLYKEKRRNIVLMNEENRERLIRYSKPTKLCCAPYGTQWLHLSEEDQEDLYIQVSQDIGKPDWRALGYVLEKAFSHRLSEESFMEECLKSYESNIEDSIQE